MRMQRLWAMPSADTFDVEPIADFVKRYLREAKVSVDPFARNKRWATHTNDLNPETAAESHEDAEIFVRRLTAQGIRADLVIFDPPYSPGQIVECYKGIGMEIDSTTGQNAALYSRVRDAIVPLCAEQATVLSFGWNSSGMGLERGFELTELLLVAHGGAHQDTICLAEKRRTGHQTNLFDAPHAARDDVP